MLVILIKLKSVFSKNFGHYAAYSKLEDKIGLPQQRTCSCFWGDHFNEQLVVIQVIFLEILEVHLLF